MGSLELWFIHEHDVTCSVLCTGLFRPGISLREIILEVQGFINKERKNNAAWVWILTKSMPCTET